MLEPAICIASCHVVSGSHFWPMKRLPVTLSDSFDISQQIGAAITDAGISLLRS